jgi:hypothetical protein
MASATESHFRLFSLPAIGSTIEPDWSIKKMKQLGFARLISAEYGILALLLAQQHVFLGNYSPIFASKTPAI